MHSTNPFDGISTFDNLIKAYAQAAESKNSWSYSYSEEIKKSLIEDGPKFQDKATIDILHNLGAKKVDNESDS